MSDPHPAVRDAARIVGRSADLALLGAFLTGAAADGGALLLTGDAGAGKTTLLEAAATAAAADGRLVLRAAGVAAETDLAYAGLHQLLYPLRGQEPHIDTDHRTALDTALGFRRGSEPSRLLVANAALMVLRCHAAHQPLLVLVDDLPWLDEPSRHVLGFVARRLAGSRAGLLGVLRSEEEDTERYADVARHELTPLDDAAADALMRTEYPWLDQRVLQQIRIEGRGNPLALLQLCAEAAGSQSGDRLVLRPVPLAHRIRPPRNPFGSRVAALPASTREFLLQAALDGTGDLRVLDANRLRDADIALAEHAQVAYIDPLSRQLVFGHPLIRAALIESATDNERRDAHRMLASLLMNDEDRRAWHLAEAAVGPDEQIAGLLRRTADRALRRGEALAAVAALTRASMLSSAGADQGRLLAAAAYVGAGVTGHLSTTWHLLADARRADPATAPSLMASMATACVLLNADGDVGSAHRVLVDALNRADPATDPAFIEAVQTLLRVCLYAGSPDLWPDVYQQAARFTANIPPSLRLHCAITADPARAEPAAVAELDAAIARLVDEESPSEIIRIGVASMFIDRVGGCRPALWRVVSDGRAGGAVAAALTAMDTLAFDDYLIGDWDQAITLAEEALQLAADRGYQLTAGPARYIPTLVAAARGDYEKARALAGELLTWAIPRRVLSVQTAARHALGLAALGRGDFEDAYQQLTAVSPAGTLAPYTPLALACPLDMVETAFRADRPAEAAAHAAAMRSANVAALSPRLALLTHASAAIVAPDDEALEHFDRALAVPDADNWPFDHGRIRLLFGERLRRRRAPREARAHLSAALETFERLRAEPWAARARTELRAAGQGAAHSGIVGAAALTAQECEIAELAASGLTNKQIGARLLMAPRTVGAHLYRIFPKLGITSRAALRDALASPTR